VNTFEDSEDTGNDIVVVDVDKEAAQEVIDAINALNDASTEEEIDAVVNMYEDLTERQKSYVTNYDKLVEQVQKITILKIIDRVNELIDSLDENSPDPDVVEEARIEYNKLLAYGDKWANKIESSKIEKLVRCELKIIADVADPLLEKAMALDTNTRQGGTHFKLLSQRIDSYLNNFEVSTRESLDLYDEYVETKAKVDQVYFIAADNYISTSHNLPSGKIWEPLKSYEDDDYGVIHEEDLTGYSLSSAQNIQFGTKADFSNYKYIAAFISWPHSGRYVQFINNERMVYASEETVANQYMYIEIPTSSLGDLLGNNHSHFGAHYENRNICNIAGYKVTNIVGIGVDIFKAQAAVDNVEALIRALDEDNLTEAAITAARKAYDQLVVDFDETWQAKVSAELVAKLIRCENKILVTQVQNLINEANSISFTNNQNKARFTLLADTINTKYAELTSEQQNMVVNYDTFTSKYASLGTKTGILYNGDFSYYYNGSTGKMEDSLSYQYGHQASLYNASPKGGNMELRYGQKGLDFRGHKKLGVFMTYSNPNTESVWLIITQSWSVTSYVYCNASNLADSSTNTYYLEFDLTKVTSAFAFDPFMQVYFSQAMSHFKTTSFVYLDE
jgi:hypothetical protein